MPLTHPALGDAHRYAVIVQSAGETIHLGPYMKEETAQAVYAVAADLAAHTPSVIVELVPSYYLPGTAKAQAKAAVSAVFPGLDDAMAANAAAAAKANAEAETAKALADAGTTAKEVNEAAQVVTPKTDEKTTDVKLSDVAPENPPLKPKTEITGVKADKPLPKKTAKKATA
jgi:hypothetical protein